MMQSLLSRTCLVAAVWACAASAGAQDLGPAGDTPAPASAQQREVGSAAARGRLDRLINWAESKAGSQTGAGDGFYAEMGGLIPGSGASAGPGYRSHLPGTGAILDTSMAISWKRYSMMQTRITWPRLLNDRLSAGGQIRYQDFTQIDFYGIGSHSLEDDRTNFRLTTLDTLGFATVHAAPWLSITGRSGMLSRVDPRQGRSALYPSIETRFDNSSAPGLTQQPNYLHADVAMDADTRNVPGYPSRGGRYRLSMAAFHDQDLAQFSFRRIDVEAAQYLPIGGSVLSLRGWFGVSQTGAGQDVPFYMLPTLGGSKTLRGYSTDRFRDRDVLMVNAEYRVPLLRRLDAAAFYDAGAVAPQAGELTRNIVGDYGIGLRLHSATHVLARLDVARGSEGLRAMVSFTAPLALSKSSVAPYVP
jgi:outer membrane protein assembly factor BamA